jgi:hypothetical protein
VRFFLGGLVACRAKIVSSCKENAPTQSIQTVPVEELRANMREVIAMLLKDGELALETEFVGLGSSGCVRRLAR